MDPLQPHRSARLSARGDFACKIISADNAKKRGDTPCCRKLQLQTLVLHVLGNVVPTVLNSKQLVVFYAKLPGCQGKKARP